jgi:hypothetical protein
MRLICMINALPREHKRIFPMSYRTAYVCLDSLRRRAAARLQNPALIQISFKSFRHWGGSMVAYYSNGNAVTRKPLQLQSMRFVLWAKAGWTKYDEATFNGVTMHFYRKPKRFGSLKNMNNTSQTMGISNYNS